MDMCLGSMDVTMERLDFLKTNVFGIFFVCFVLRVYLPCGKLSPLTCKITDLVISILLKSDSLFFFFF